MPASACIGDAAELDRARQLAMIDLNMRALTDLSLRFIDGVKRQRGGILNVASIAGFLPGPGMAVYHATKAYVLSFTEALHAELARRRRARLRALPGAGRDRILRARRHSRTSHFPSFFVRTSGTRGARGL